MLLTVNSIKKSVLNDSYSLIITNTDDEHDARRALLHKDLKLKLL